MTERLTELLAREADTLDVPSPQAGDILGAGRRLRRRRSARISGIAALALAVVAGGAVLVGTRGGDQTVAPATSPPIQVAWGAADTVYTGTEGHAVEMPEVAQTLYYTSAGILVRTNKDGASDGGAPFHFQLVRADGTTSKLGVTLGEVVPSTDPTEPYLAWATKSGGHLRVVVHDVSTDQDVATVDVPGTFTWGGWAAPPVALSGDLVYVGTNDHTTVVNWRTGQANTTDVLPEHTVPQVAGGRSAIVTGRVRKQRVAVVDVGTGGDLLDVAIGVGDSVRLSPDGRFLLVTKALAAPPVRTTVYDVDSDHSVRLPESAFGYAWSADGQIFSVGIDTLFTCAATTGSCRSSHVPSVGRTLVRYAGIPFES
jgi:hypothetical protein